MRRFRLVAIGLLIVGLACAASAPGSPALAEVRIPCLLSPFSGCSFTFVSPEYAARPVQALDPQKALEAVNAFRVNNGLADSRARCEAFSSCRHAIQFSGGTELDGSLRR